MVLLAVSRLGNRTCLFKKMLYPIDGNLYSAGFLWVNVLNYRFGYKSFRALVPAKIIKILKSVDFFSQNYF